jgi:carbamate kinase
MRVVAALGGNALLRRGQPAEAEAQRQNLVKAGKALAELTLEHELIVTHGNGPQVGLLALQSEAYGRVRPYPVDILVAESEGMVGYLLDQTLGNLLPDRRVATLLTQTVVDERDPAFGNPTKPVGPVYPEEQARQIAGERGWSVGSDGKGWRRVVPSPEPLRIVELETIRLLVEAGVLVICSGGGGVPVVDHHGVLHGVEAVIDKDLAAALLAIDLGADALLLLTDVRGVEDGFGTASARVISQATPDELRALDLPPGSMQPKVEAASRFAERTRGIAVISSLEDAAISLEGYAGTRIVTPRREPAMDGGERRHPHGPARLPQMRPPA